MLENYSASMGSSIGKNPLKFTWAMHPVPEEKFQFLWEENSNPVTLKFESSLSVGASTPQVSSITPQNRLEGSQRASSKETYGHRKMAEDLSFFNEKHGVYFSNLMETFNIDEVQARALIWHESRFVHNAKNIHGSKGYMQLTGAPIRDLEARPQLYAPLYSKIDPSTLPEGTPKELRELIAIFQEWPQSYKRIRQLIPGLLAKKDEPTVNLTLGSVYLAALGNRIETRWVPQKISEFVEKRTKILSSNSFLSLVSRRIQDQLPLAEVSQIRNILKESKDNLEMQKYFLQLRDYNGNVSKYGSGIEHRDIYAAVVMVVSELAKRDSTMKSRIS